METLIMAHRPHQHQPPPTPDMFSSVVSDPNMLSDTDISKRVDALRITMNIAEDLKNLLAQNVISQPENVLTYHSIPFLDLVSINAIPLEELGLPETVSRRLCAKISDAITKAKVEHTEHYETTCRKLLAIHRPEELPSIFETLKRAYKLSFEQHFLPLVKERVVKLVKSLAKSQQDTEIQTKRKTPFNNACTPLLEHYFKLNAYPHASDRQLLAHKTMMSLRQIDVWFQNHRRRARQEGKYLRRITGPVPVDLDLESLEKKLSSSEFVKKEKVNIREAPTESSDDDNEELSSCMSLVLPSISSDILNPRSPAHAYPMPYRPTKKSHIFSLKYDGEGYEFHPPAPEWRRKPALASVPPSTSPIDILAFIQHFQSELSITKGIFGERPKQNQPPQGYWFAHRYTLLSPAPHPALIQTSPRSTSQNLHISICPTDQSSCLIPPSGHLKTQAASKFELSVPKRIPSLPSPSPACRSSPYNSAYSSRTRSISSSSSSSSSLSTPSTSPYLSLLSLPQSTNLSKSLPEFALQDQIFKSLYGTIPISNFTDFSFKTMHSGLLLQNSFPVVGVHA